MERLDQPEKNWKFSVNDVHERGHWDEYMDAYEDMIRHTSTPECPWYVVPADNKWYTRAIIAAAVIDALGGLDLHYPKVSTQMQAELREAKAKLLAED